MNLTTGNFSTDIVTIKSQLEMALTVLRIDKEPSCTLLSCTLLMRGAHVKSRRIEEPDDRKLSCPVLQTSGGGDPSTEFNYDDRAELETLAQRGLHRELIGRTAGESFDIVTFQRQGDQLTDPLWRPTTKTTVEAMLGGKLP